MRDSTRAVVLVLVHLLLVACGPQARDPGTGDDDDPCSAPGSCTVCTPGTGTCDGNMGHACNSDGTGFVDEFCDPVQGVTCNGDSGKCEGACSATELGTSYIGCEYYPTVTGNMVSSGYNYAVAIANTTNDIANVTIEGGALTSAMSIAVPPNSVKVQTLPWQTALKLCMGASWSSCASGIQADAALAPKGAYHLRSSRPVTVYQFNPLEYDLISTVGENSFTNDASLLLPTNVWKLRYFAAAWQATAGLNPSELAVTAWQDNTQVTITTTANTSPAGGAPGFVAGMPQTVTLNAGDVIEITSRTGDLTGSKIESTLPVQVISGHYCANVPDGVAACDHLEESMFAVDALGFRYIVNAPAVTTIPSGKVEVVRIIATESNTNLTYDPPQPGAPTTIAQAGGFVELQNNASSFSIQADHKVLVAQYMEGQDAGGGTGDPAMALAVPVEQFRTSYLFHAPVNYESNYVDVTAPMGSNILLDGAPLALTAIGTTGFGFVRVYPLSAGPGNDGNHSMSGDQAFGITVYGYGQYTSYWYPGGLNLTTILN